MATPWLQPRFERPLRVEVSPSVHVRPMSPGDLDIDMPAVMGNPQMLWDKYGDAWGWPPTTMTANATAPSPLVSRPRLVQVTNSGRKHTARPVQAHGPPPEKSPLAQERHGEARLAGGQKPAGDQKPAAVTAFGPSRRIG